MPDLRQLIGPPMPSGKGGGLRSFYTNLRNNLHGTFNPTADMESPNLHRDAMRSATNSLSQFMEPEIAASVMDIPGFANETIAGALAPTLAKPKPFFSKQGFDWGDIEQNRQGQNLAMVDQQGQPPPLSRLLQMLSPGMGPLNNAVRMTRGRR